MSNKAIIFDLDGTIVFSLPTHFEAYRMLFSEFGITWTPPAGFERTFTNIGPASIIQSILEEHGEKNFDVKSLVGRKRELFNKVLEEKTLPVVPGFFEFLAEVRAAGLKKTIASGSGRANIYRMLKSIGVSDDFPDAVSGEDVSRAKPAPDIYLLAAQRLGVHPHECCAIEDTPEGVLSAKTAGMKCAAFTTTIQDPKVLQQAGADIVVKDYFELSLKDLGNLS